METRVDRIRALLQDAFAPLVLDVRDTSAKHVGHPGSRPGGGTHYSVHLVSAVFAGQSRVLRARAVHAVLDQEFANGLHALSLKLEAPEEVPGGSVA